MITLSSSAWAAVHAQSSATARAQALVTLLGAGSVEFRDGTDTLIRSVTFPSWTATGATIKPASYTDAAVGAGAPVVAVFKDSDGDEVLRVDCGTSVDSTYRLAAAFEEGVPLLADGFALTMPAPLSQGLPVNTKAPGIGGSPVVGTILQSTAGTWIGADSVARQWLRNGLAISSEIGTTYKVSSLDLNAMLSLRETATNANGSTQAVSSEIGPVRAGALGFSGLPVTLEIEQGKSYELAPHVSGGTPPYKDFAVAAGTLPTGLALDAATGRLTAAADAALETKAGVKFKVSDSYVSVPEIVDLTFPQYLVDDTGRGPSYKFWNVELQQFWPSYIESLKNNALNGAPITYNGDWTNTEGNRSFTLPYASKFFPGGTLGWIEIDITTLAQRWITDNRGAFLYSPSYGRLYFDGRLAENPPQLVVTTPSGDVTFSPGYASHFYTSSTSPYVTSTECRLASGSRVLLHWRDIEIPADMTAAKIRLFVRESNPTTGETVQVYETNIPRVRIGNGGADPVLGLAAEVGEANLPGHPDVYEAGDFSPENWFAYRPEEGAWGTNYNQTVPLCHHSGLARDIVGFESSFQTEDDGTTSMRASFVHGQGRIADISSFGAKTNRTRADYSDPARPVDPSTIIEEMYARVYMLLEEDFWTTTSGVKFGIGWDLRLGIWSDNQNGYWLNTTGSGQTYADGRRALTTGGRWDYHGHSIRQHLFTCRPTGTRYAKYRPFKADVSHLGPYYAGSGVTGSEEDYPFPGVVFELGKWHCVETRIKLNSVVGPFDADGNGEAVADGVLEYWADGVLAFRRDTFRWRRHPHMSVQGYWMNMLHGGSTPPAPGEVMHYKLNHFVAAKRYIGPKG